MRELTEQELYNALAYAKSIDEAVGAKIIENFHKEQPALAPAIFSIFPQFINEKNEEMAYLFMDLCFDILCVFQHAFGQLPSQNEIDSDWLEKQAVLIDTELQALNDNAHMDEKIRSKLEDRFIERMIEDGTQTGLVRFMNESIDEFAAESPSRVDATKTTQTMIFIVIRLFANLYSHAKTV